MEIWWKSDVNLTEICWIYKSDGNLMEIWWKSDGNLMDWQIWWKYDGNDAEITISSPLCAQNRDTAKYAKQGIRWKSDGYPMEIRWKSDGFPMVSSFRKSRKSRAQKQNSRKSRAHKHKQTHLCICWITNKKEHAQKTECCAWFWAYRHVTVMCWRFMCSRYCKGTTHCVEMALTREGDGARRLRSQGGRRLRSQGGASEAWGCRVPAQGSIYVC